MIQTRNLLIVSLIIAITTLSQSSVLAQITTTEKMTSLLNDMWNYYGVFSKLQNDTEREDLVKQMEATSGKILEYYKNYQNPDTSQMKLTAQAFLLLAIVESEMHNPTWTYHALQTVEGINWGVVGDINLITNRSFKEWIDGIDTVWLPKFKKCFAQVYGFPENMIWDTLEVEIGINYLGVEDRTEENFKAINGAQDYLNSEIRDGSKEVTLLLPPGSYELDGEGLDIYPTRFEVEELTDSITFDITPDEWFNLRVCYCRYNQKVDVTFTQGKIDTNFVEGKKYRNYILATVDTSYDTVRTHSVEVQKLPIAPKSLSIWKGNKRVLYFDHLAYGVYEFGDAKKFGITDDYRFKRFLPEGIKWDMPRNERFEAEDIYVRSGHTYDYCIDLPGKRKVRNPVTWPVSDYTEIECRNTRWYEPFLYTAFMVTVFGFYLDTVR